MVMMAVLLSFTLRVLSPAAASVFVCRAGQRTLGLRHSLRLTALGYFILNFVMSTLVWAFVGVDSRSPIIFFFMILQTLILVRLFFAGDRLEKAAFSMVVCTIQAVSQSLFDALDYAGQAYAGTYTGGIFGSMVGLRLLCAVLDTVCVCVLLEVVSRKCGDLRTGVPESLLLRLFIPGVFILLSIFCYYNGYYWMDFIQYVENGEVHSFGFFINLLSLAAYLALALGGMLILLYTVNRSVRGILLKQELALQAEHYSDLEQQHRKMNMVRSEIENHIDCAHGLIAQGDNEAAVYYFSHISDALDTMRYGINTGDDMVDAILNIKGDCAKSGDITFFCDVSLPEHSRMDRLDLCVIFGGLLDHALASCGQVKSKGCKKTIRLFTAVEETCMRIQVEHTMKGAKWSSASLVPKDSPRGISLSGIRSVVEKYHGKVDFQEEEHSFAVKLVLRLEA